MRECCVNQPCDDDDGRLTVSSVPLPLARRRRSSRQDRYALAVRSLFRESARGGEREREESLAVAIPDENSGQVLSLSLALSVFRSFVLLVSFGRVSPGVTSRCQVAERKHEGGATGERWDGAGRWERGAGGHVRSRTFRVAGNIVGADRRNADERVCCPRRDREIGQAPFAVSVTGLAKFDHVF